MTITQANYLDFYNLFVNELFGGAAIFTIFGLFFISYWLIKNNLPVEVVLIANLAFVGLVLVAEASSAKLLWFITIIVFGFIIYTALPKLVQR